MPKNRIHDLESAIELAAMAHAGQVDKAGQPYILHPLRVMLAMPDNETLRIVAVLHDVVEDCDTVGLGDILAHFEEEVWAAVNALTKRNSEDYNAYLARVVENPIAARVKLADIEDNMSPSRRDVLTAAQKAKYHNARMFVEKYL